ncbi:MAG: transcriptional repressor, partial [Leptonema sp. (in: Bacteria)]|nr:transcriptional repressor [Leptonema sp. (in: bacteria)]
LKLFVEKNVVRELIIASDRIYYDSNTVSHHHFVDVETGQIFDIPLCIVPIPELSRLNMGNAQVFEASVILRGRFGQTQKYAEVQSNLADQVLTSSESCALTPNSNRVSTNEGSTENVAVISHRRPLKSVAVVS